MSKAFILAFLLIGATVSILPSCSVTFTDYPLQFENSGVFQDLDYTSFVRACLDPVSNEIRYSTQQQNSNGQPTFSQGYYGLFDTVAEITTDLSSYTSLPTLVGIIPDSTATLTVPYYLVIQGTLSNGTVVFAA